MKKLFKKGKKWILGLAMAVAVFGATVAINAQYAIPWPTAVVNQSNIVNTNYPGGTWTAKYASYGRGEFYSTTTRGTGSNAAIEWIGYVNNDAIPGMSKPLGKQELASKKNFMFEDTFNYNPIDIENIALFTTIFVPICLDVDDCQAAKTLGSGTAMVAKNKPLCGTTDAEECYYRASSGVTNGQQLMFDFKSLMSEVKQNSGETLEQFRSRISQNAMTYGIYDYNPDNGLTPGSVSSNSKTLIINFGEIGNNGMNISKATLSYVQNGEAKTISGSDDAIYGILADKLLGTNGVSNGGTSNFANFKQNFAGGVLPENIHELLTKYYKDVYGPDNLTNGDVAWFGVNSTVNYLPSANGFGIGNSLENLKGLANTPFISYDVKNSTTGELENKKVKSANSYPGGIQATPIAAAQSKEAVLYLFNRTYSYSNPSLIATVDGTTLASKDYIPPLSGAKFTLQKLDGTTWTNVQTDLVTGADGTIKVSGLAAGSYRFVQTAVQDDSKYLIPWSLKKSCLKTITDPDSGLYESTSAANGFNGSQKVGCNWDEDDKALVSNQFTISDSQGANIYIPNIIDPLKDIYYDLDGGTPAKYASAYQKYYPIGVGVPALAAANGSLLGGGYLPTREGYEFAGWCETKTETNGVEHGKDCGYENTSDPNILIPKPFDKVTSIPSDYNWDVPLKAMWKSKAVIPKAPGIEYTDGTAIETTVDEATGKVTITDPSALICEKDLQLVIPSVENLTYTSEKISAEGVYPIQYKVTATPADGYALDPTDARTEWTVEIPESKACPVEDVYTITYVLYGGTNNASNPSTYVAGEGVAKFEEPTLANGQFIKWYMLKDDIMKVRDSRVSFDDLEEITGLSDKQTGDVTIYARWYVTPLAPELDTKNSVCEVDHKVIIPKQEGIKFTTTQEGKIVKVKATIENDYKEGYVFADGADTEWTFDVTNSEKCPVTPPTGPGEKPEPGKPGTTNPTNPLPETGSELMVLGLSLLSITGLGLVGYRRFSNRYNKLN